jgi:CRISPR-associated endonuclease Cas1
MWANDDDFGIRDGVLVLSKNPSLKVERDRLVIGDGYQPGTSKKPHLLRLARAESARGRLRHIVMVGEAGWVSNAAHLWLRDVGCALSLIDPSGSVVFSTGPRGPDRPWLRRQQVLVGVGVAPGTVEIARALLLVKLTGQSAVLRQLGGAEAAAGEVALLEDALRAEIDAAKILSLEARAGVAYWQAWFDMPVSFARQRPGGFSKDGRWRESLPVPEHWLRFGRRSSMLTAKPWRATDPANACLNLAYALLRCEMTIALMAQSLDPGHGLFHNDADGRPSLSLDAMEPIRPLADAYVASFLSESSFLLRDFTQTADGELRVSHPLRQHLGRCATLFREPCERVAAWLARAFEAAARMERVEGAGARANRATLVTHIAFPSGPPRLPVLSLSKNAADIGRGFLGPREGYRGLTHASRLPKSCAECDRAVTGKQRRFCSRACAAARLAATGAAMSEESKRRRIESVRADHAARRSWEAGHAADRAALDRWYSAEIKPRLATLRQVDIQRSLQVSQRYAVNIKQGRRTPHPRHYEALARLAGVQVPPLETPRS